MSDEARIADLWIAVYVRGPRVTHCGHFHWREGLARRCAAARSRANGEAWRVARVEFASQATGQ